MEPPFKPDLYKCNFDEQFINDTSVITVGHNGVCNRLRSSAQTTLHTFARQTPTAQMQEETKFVQQENEKYSDFYYVRPDLPLRPPKKVLSKVHSEILSAKTADRR